jgi:hypothetical protein
MKIRTVSTATINPEFGDRKWAVLFHGVELDDRSSNAVTYAKERSTKVIHATFNTAQPGSLYVNSMKTQPRELATSLRSVDRIVLECTSLGTVEMLFILRAAKDAKVNHVDCLYVEPIEYSRNVSLQDIWTREFWLSESREFSGVHGFLANLQSEPKETKFVAFLGYEASRLAQFFERFDQLEGFSKYAVFGVPSFAPGWEMNAMINNSDTLFDQDFDSVRYCSAASVSGAFDLLKKIHEEGRNEHIHTIVAPLGTKPHAIASALFLVSNNAYQATSLLYDHPVRSKGRSSQTRRWHLYEIQGLDK